MAHNKDNMCLSEERSTTLIRETFREEFEKQQKNILKGTLMQIWKSPYLIYFICPEYFAFLILTFLGLFARKVHIFLEK